MESIRDLIRRKGSTVLTIGPEASVFEAIQLLSQGKVGALAVVDGESLVGIVSERDYTRKIALVGRSSHQALVKEIMTRNPVCVGFDHTVEDCMVLLTERDFRHLPVVDDAKLVGMISIKDVLRSVVAHRDLLLDRAVLAGHRNLVANGSARVRVLLAESDRGETVTARTALGGTGVIVDIVSDVATGAAHLSRNVYDVLFVNRELIELARVAREKHAAIKTVFMTAEAASRYLPLLREYPFLTNIVSRDDADSSSTVRSIVTTVGKLLSGDIFGLEKYLIWGADVREHLVSGSQDRGPTLETMTRYLTQVGVRANVLRKCVAVADELLMNVIWDAPHDRDGRALYNHLPRTIPVHLKPHEHAAFRYACDGMLVAVSARDPFGALDRTTILQHLERCYGGDESPLPDHKAGAGRGIHIVIESAELVVFNVKQGVKTEVVALFNLARNIKRSSKSSSFQYFNE